MNKLLLALTVAATVATTGCTSIETGALSDAEFTAAGGSPQGVIQVSSVGFSLFLYFVDVVNSDFDSTNKVLVNEAKGMGATKVELKGANTVPRHGIFSLFCLLACFPTTQVVGVAVK